MQYHDNTLKRIQARGPGVTRTLPGYNEHALEALCELSSWLARRYPAFFQVERTRYDAEKQETWGDSVEGLDSGRVRRISNKITGEVWDLDQIREREGPDWNPMRIAGRELRLVHLKFGSLKLRDKSEHLKKCSSLMTSSSWLKTTTASIGFRQAP